MGITIGDAVLWIRAKSERFDDDLKKIDGKLLEFAQSAGEKLTDIGNKLSLAVTLPIVAGLGVSIKAASDFNETLNKSNIVFGENAKQMQKFADGAAKSLGMSKNEALSAASTFGNLFHTMGVGQATTVEMSTNLVKLAADIASFNNLDPTDILRKLQSGLVGEMEPMRSLGINLSEAAVKAKAAELGLQGVNGELTEAEKVQARYALILDQTKTAQGDFARTADGMANQTRIMKAQVSDLAIMMGNNLLPVAQKVLTVVNQLLEKFNNLTPTQQKIIIGLLLMVAAIGPVLSILGSIITIVSGAIGALTVLSGMGITLSSVFAAFGTIFGALGTVIPAVIGIILSPIGLLVAAIGLLIFTLITLGPQALRTLQQLGQIFLYYVGGLANNVRTWFANVGKGIIDGIWAGISNGWAWLNTQVSDLAQSLLKTAKDKLGIKSPSQVFADQVGANITAGIGMGFQESLPKLTAQMQMSLNPFPAVTNAGQSMNVGHIEYHGSFSADELNRLDRRSKRIANNTLEDNFR